MPNGHGGIPFLGAPVLLAALVVAAVAIPVEHPSPLGYVRVAASVVLAATCGWRLAYHIHMRAADDYGGAHTEEAEFAKSRRRYRVLSIIYAVALVVATLAALHARGSL